MTYILYINKKHHMTYRVTQVSLKMTLKTTPIMCLKLMPRVIRSLTMKVQMSKQPQWKTPIYQVGKPKLVFPKYKRYRTYPLKQLTEGEPQEYEVPICTMPTK